MEGPSDISGQFGGVYRDVPVLITGHTGFKGSWLSCWLDMMGARVTGFSDRVPTEPSNFELLRLSDRFVDLRGDVRDPDAISAALEESRPEIVIHLAAQAIVRRSYEDPVETIRTNSLGTLNVLEGFRSSPWVKAAVLITSDKCYHNLEWMWGYRENDRLGGDDPYSASKACAEMIAATYMASFFNEDGPWVATARAGNVIGGGDWAPDRIVPDCVRAWSRGDSVRIRNPGATRPWQHVLEPLGGYLWLGANLLRKNPRVRNQAFNFGPRATVNRSVGELLTELTNHWPGAVWERDDPGEGASLPESGLLKLNCDKALHLLGWHAALSFEETVHYTADWYQAHSSNEDADLTGLARSQIVSYGQQAALQSLRWAAGAEPGGNEG